MLRQAVVAVALMFVLAGSAAPAQAGFVTVAFSYQFTNGETLSGLVQGNGLAGDRLYVDRILSAEYSGTPGVQFTYQSDFLLDWISLSGTSPFYLNGFESDPNTTDETLNRGFMLSNSDVTNAVSVGTFRTSSSVIYNPVGSENFAAERFSIASYSAAVVPEPSTLTLLGLAGPALALALKRRKSA